MTTYIAFAPKSTGIPWTGNLTLDGQVYKAQAAWNIYGQRWYLSLADSSGVVVWYGPIIDSPLDYDILLAPGVFSASTLLYRADTGNFEITAAAPVKAVHLINHTITPGWERGQ